MERRSAQLAGDILKQGYAKAALSEEESNALTEAFEAGRRFFALPLDVKSRYIAPDLNHGYRPFGKEFSATADRPDLNECFTLWHNRTDLIPNAADIPNLLEAWHRWRNVLVPIVDWILLEVAAHFSSQVRIDFQAASYLQMNGYTDPTSDRDLLQDLHEDGHMLTVHHANAPGLEARIDGAVQPVDLAPSEVLLMPGSVLTDLSDGAIEPFYHQVRNLHNAERSSMMYFINPSLDQPVYSWLDTDQSHDLRDKVRTNPSMFGLVDVPIL